LQPPQGAAQLGPQAAGAQQLASTGAQQVGSLQQLLPHEEPQPCPLNSRNFGILNLGMCSFGILKPRPQPLWHPLSHPQLSPQVLQQSTGAQQLASTAGPQPLPQAAGAQQVASTGAQQLASTAGPQPLPQAAGAQHDASTGAQQLASTGAQQLGSELHPQPLLWLNRPNNPACALFAIEKTTRAAVSVIAFISILLHIVLAE
jgi:hypothetical protein